MDYKTHCDSLKYVAMAKGTLKSWKLIFRSQTPKEHQNNAGAEHLIHQQQLINHTIQQPQQQQPHDNFNSSTIVTAIDVFNSPSVENIDNDPTTSTTTITTTATIVSATTTTETANQNYNKNSFWIWITDS